MFCLSVGKEMALLVLRRVGFECRAKPNAPFAGWQIVLKNVRWGKIKNSGSGKRVGLFLVRSLYGFYFVFHFPNGLHFLFTPSLSMVTGSFYTCCQRPSIRAVADFRAITCPPPPRFIKCIDLEFTTSPAIAFIQCCMPVLFLRPCVGAAILFGKFCLVRLL